MAKNFKLLQARMSVEARERSEAKADEMIKVALDEFPIELEQEVDGRWIAEVVDLPGVLVYGKDPKEAQAKVKALALRVLAYGMGGH